MFAEYRVHVTNNDLRQVHSRKEFYGWGLKVSGLLS